MLVLLARFRPVHPRMFVTILQVGSKSIGAVDMLAHSYSMSLSEGLKPRGLDEERARDRCVHAFRCPSARLCNSSLAPVIETNERNPPGGEGLSRL